MATERRHMQPKRTQPRRDQQASTAGRSIRAPIPRVLLVLLPFLALAVGACGGGEGGDEPTDSGDPGPPTAADVSADSESRASGSGASTSGASASAPAPSTEAPASPSSDAGGPPYAVQLGAFERESNAQQLRESLEDAGFPVRTGETGTSGATLLRVRVGATRTVAEARRLVDAIRARLPGVPDSVWIAPLEPEGEASEEMMTATRAILDDG